MALNDIIFNRQATGLSRPLANNDHISGFVFFTANANLGSGNPLPGFETTDRYKAVFSLSEAEALGFTEGSAVSGEFWYHIDQFFKIQPRGKLWIGMFDSLLVGYNEHEELQNAAEGEIRQIGFCDTATAFSSTNLNTIQTSCNTLQTNHRPVSVIYAADISGVADLSTLADLRALTNKNVSMVIGEDGGGAGAALAVSLGHSVTCLGQALGAVALAQVNENVGWVNKFNLVQGSELDVPAFANGDLFKDTSVGLQTSLQDKGYMFLRKLEGIAGTYLNDSSTAITITNDFAYIENNRTIDKAVRNVRTFLLPNLNGPILVDPDTGKLAEDTIAVYKNDSDRALEQMQRNGEISGFRTTINPEQDVLSTSKISLKIELVPVGVARVIEVNIGFTVSLT